MCPDGYIAMDGDVCCQEHWISGPAGDWFTPMSSMEKCKELCDTTADCKAILWSPTNLNCLMSKTPVTTGHVQYKDYQLCSKGTRNYRLNKCDIS